MCPINMSGFCRRLASASSSVEVNLQSFLSLHPVPSQLQDGSVSAAGLVLGGGRCSRGESRPHSDALLSHRGGKHRQSLGLVPVAGSEPAGPVSVLGSVDSERISPAASGSASGRPHLAVWIGRNSSLRPSGQDGPCPSLPLRLEPLGAQLLTGPVSRECSLLPWAALEGGSHLARGPSSADAWRAGPEPERLAVSPKTAHPETSQRCLKEKRS